MYLSSLALLRYVEDKSSLCLLSFHLFSLCRRLAYYEGQMTLQITMSGYQFGNMEPQTFA